MRTVLHITGMRSTKYGALEAYLVQMCRLVDSCGFRTVLQYKSMPESAAYMEDLDRVAGHAIAMPLQGGMLATAWHVAWLLLRYRPEVVILHFPGGNEYVTYVVPVLCRMFGVYRSIRIVHGLHCPSLHHGKAWALGCFDHILCVSDAVADRFSQSGYRLPNLRRHYLGLVGNRRSAPDMRGMLRDRLGIAPSCQVVATIVFDDRVKGLDVLLRSIAELSAGRERLLLLVIGVDPATSEFSRLAVRLGISRGVRWTSIQDGGWQYLNAADVYVQPSRSEGLPLAVLEAMALGLPVVATRVGGLPEAVMHEQTGMLVPPEDPRELAEAIAFLLDDPALASRLGDAGRNRCATHFNGERSAATLVKEYCGLPLHVEEAPMGEGRPLADSAGGRGL